MIAIPVLNPKNIKEVKVFVTTANYETYTYLYIIYVALFYDSKLDLLVYQFKNIFLTLHDE